jgi:hypothetical protein
MALQNDLVSAYRSAFTAHISLAYGSMGFSCFGHGAENWKAIVTRGLASGDGEEPIAIYRDHLAGEDCIHSTIFKSIILT